MKISTKIGVTLVVTLFVAMLYRVLLPAAYLASNQVVVAQLSQSDSASLALDLIGNGGHAVRVTLLVIYFVAMYFLWRKRTNKEDQK